jgi:hypothetical protein
MAARISYHPHLHPRCNRPTPSPPPRCLSQRGGVASEKAACAASRAAPVPYRAPRSGYCIAPTLRQLARECRKRAAPHGAGALPHRNCACTSWRPSDGCDTLHTHPTCRLDTRGADIRARLAVSRARLTDAHPSRRYPRWARCPSRPRRSPTSRARAAFHSPRPIRRLVASTVVSTLTRRLKPRRWRRPDSTTCRLNTRG